MTRKTHSASRTAPLRPEDEKLGIGASFAYGFQHVLTMYGGIIAVPLIIGQASGLSPADVGLLIAACLFMGGLATLLQTIGVPFFGSQLPLVQGTSFAGVATMLAILNGGGGIQSIFGAVIVASLIGLLITPVFQRIIKFFPPVVTGTVIAVIGLTLMPTAAGWAMGGNSRAPDFGSPANIGLAGLTLAIVLLLSKIGSGTISRLSILLAMIIGTVVAVFMGRTDFSKVGTGPIFAFPSPFHFGMPTFQAAGIISMVIVILVTLVETSADILAVSEIIGTKVDSRRLGNGLRADMISSAVAPVFGSFPQTAFAQNVGLVAITGIKSRFAVTASGVILLVLGLLPVMGRVVAAVPTAVLGGAGIVLFGTVAASGIRTLSTVSYKNNMNLVIVATSIGFGVIPIVQPTFYSQFPAWFSTIFDSGISSAAVMAIVLNLLFNHLKRGNPENPSVFAAATERAVPWELVKHLEDGDRCENGRIISADGREVAVTGENPVIEAHPEPKPVH